MRAKENSIFLAFGFMLLLGCFTRAHAIPAFSREHNTECATCHTIYPELNEYGDAFLKNGFVWNKHKKGENADNAPQIKGEGDPDLLRQLKEVAAAGLPQKAEENAAPSAAKKSEPLWLAGLPQTLPLSLSANLNASYNDTAKYDKLDLSTRAVSLLAGGVVRDKLGFFLKYNLYAEGVFDPAQSNTPLNLGSPYASDLEEFYLVWRKALGTPLNFKAGRMRPTLSLWKKSNKTGISDFATTSFRAGRSTFSADAPADALEVNSILLNRLYLATGIVDRNGQDANEGYAHVSMKIGGSDFKANEPDLDLDKESILDYMYLVLGGYGYFGRNSYDLYSMQRNNFYRAGADADLVIKNARVKLAFAREKDKNPDFISHVSSTTDVLLAQAEYMLTPDLLAFIRYEYVTVDNGSRTNRYIPAVAYAPIQNVKLTAEYQHVSQKSAGLKTDSNIALLGVRIAF